MRLEITLIRHGQTKGLEDRLIGVTDKPLREEGRRLLCQKRNTGVYPMADLVYSSGLLRCVETARIIYPTGLVLVENGLDAPDYGEFEGRTYQELAVDESFIRWESSGRLQSGLGVEGPHMLSSRSAAAFHRICDKMASSGAARTSIISHKVVIEAILRRYHMPRIGYVDMSLPPAGGYILEYNTVTGTLEIREKF